MVVAPIGLLQGPGGYDLRVVARDDDIDARLKSATALRGMKTVASVARVRQ